MEEITMYKLGNYDIDIRGRHDLIFEKEKCPTGQIDMKYIDRFGNIASSSHNISITNCEDIDLNLGIYYDNPDMFRIFSETSNGEYWLSSWNKSFLYIVKDFKPYLYPVIAQDYIGHFMIYAILSESDMEEIKDYVDEISASYGCIDFTYRKTRGSKRIDCPLYECALDVNDRDYMELFGNNLPLSIPKLIQNYMSSAISGKTFLNAKRVDTHNLIICCPSCYHKYGTLQIKNDLSCGNIHETIIPSGKQCVRCGTRFASQNKYQMSRTNQLVSIDENMYPIVKFMYEQYKIHSIACCESHPPFDSDMYLYAYAENQDDFDWIYRIFKNSGHFDIIVQKFDSKNDKEENDCYKNDSKEIVRFVIRLKPLFQKRNITDQIKDVHLKTWMTLLNRASDFPSSIR